MSLQVSIPSLPDLRAVLVSAALVCLCVSSNVGLQFFPLAAAKTQVALDDQPDQVNKVTHAPQASARSFRIPMMVQSNKRTDKQAPQADLLLALPNERVELPSDIRVALEPGDRVCFLPSVAAAPHHGRGPPPSV
jgi:hypothetical protein